MTTTDTERYVRITLLTFEGGSWISKKILYRELDKTPGLTIATLLNISKDSLKRKQSHGEITGAQFDILYPRSGAGTDVEEWDLSLLVKIIFFLFDSSLNLQEIEDLKAIISVRNDVVCHASQPQIKESDFFVYWTKLTVSIQRLAFGFDNDTNQYADDLIAKLVQGPLDLQTSMDKLAQLCRNDEHMESVLAGLSRLEIRQTKMAAGIVSANTKLDDVLALLQGSQITCDDGQCKVEIPSSKVCIVGKKEDVVKVAEDIVLKVLKSAVNKVDDPANDENVKTAVKGLLEDIEAKDAVAVSADLGSIILSLKCFSLQGLEHVLKWFKSSSNEIRLHSIEEALSEMFNEQLQVVLVLPQETLDRLFVWLAEICPARDDRTFKREISMGIQCQSADAASQVLQYLHSGDSTNRLNQLSEALSEAVNDKVKVEMEVDVEGFHRALTSISTTGTATEDRSSAQDEERIKTDIAGHDGPNMGEAELSGSHDKQNESPKSKHTEQTRAEKETGPDQRGNLGGNWWPSLRGVVDTVGAAVGSAVGVVSASAPASWFGIWDTGAGSIAGDVSLPLTSPNTPSSPPTTGDVPNLLDRKLSTKRSDENVDKLLERSQHEHKMEQLKREKKAALADEITPIKAALDTMRKANEEELETEKEKYHHAPKTMFTDNYVEDIRRRHEIEAEKLREELKQISRCTTTANVRTTSWPEPRPTTNWSKSTYPSFHQRARSSSLEENHGSDFHRFSRKRTARSTKVETPTDAAGVSVPKI